MSMFPTSRTIGATRRPDIRRSRPSLESPEGRAVPSTVAAHVARSQLDEFGPSVDLASFAPPLTQLDITTSTDQQAGSGGGISSISDVIQGFAQAAVPEPASLLLLGLGLAAVAGCAVRGRPAARAAPRRDRPARWGRTERPAKCARPGLTNNNAGPLGDPSRADWGDTRHFVHRIPVRPPLRGACGAVSVGPDSSTSPDSASRHDRLERKGAARIRNTILNATRMCVAVMLLDGTVAFADIIAAVPIGGLATVPNTLPVTVGWSFGVDQDITVTSLGFWNFGMQPFLEDHPVGIWTASGTLLGSATVLMDSPLIDGFRYVDTAHFSLLAGQTYVIGGLVPALDSVYLTNAIVDTAPEITYGDSRIAYTATPTLTFPNQIGGEPNGNFGPNFQFHVVPEPATWVLITIGLLPVVGVLRLRRRAEGRSRRVGGCVWVRREVEKGKGDTTHKSGSVWGTEQTARPCATTLAIIPWPWR